MMLLVAVLFCFSALVHANEAEEALETMLGIQCKDGQATFTMVDIMAANELCYLAKDGRITMRTEKVPAGREHDWATYGVILQEGVPSYRFALDQVGDRMVPVVWNVYSFRPMRVATGTGSVMVGELTPEFSGLVWATLVYTDPEFKKGWKSFLDGADEVVVQYNEKATSMAHLIVLLDETVWTLTNQTETVFQSRDIDLLHSDLTAEERYTLGRRAAATAFYTAWMQVIRDRG